MMKLVEFRKMGGGRTAIDPRIVRSYEDGYYKGEPCVWIAFNDGGKSIAVDSDFAGVSDTMHGVVSEQCIEPAPLPDDEIPF